MGGRRRFLAVLNEELPLHIMLHNAVGWTTCPVPLIVTDCMASSKSYGFDAYFDNPNSTEERHCEG
jgi:hypothetical protein